MGRSLIFIFVFLASQLCPGVLGRNEGVLGASYTVSLNKVRGTIERCEALHLGIVNETFQIHSDSKEPFHFVETSFQDSCTFIISKFESKHAGEWIITPFVKESGNSNEPQRITIYEVKKLSVLPERKIVGVADEWVTAYLNSELPVGANCTLSNKDMTRVYDLRNGTLPAGLKSHNRECGVRMKVDFGKHNEWCIVESNGYSIKEGCFEVYFVNDDVTTRTTRMFYEHQYVQLQLDVFDEVNGKEISLKDPRGVDRKIVENKNFIFERISTADEGIWIAKYKLDSRRTVQKEYEILTRDIPEFTVDVNKTESKIEMRCLASLKKLHQCTFVKPNGTTIDASTALRTAKYDLVESADLKEDVLKECNLTIHNPSAEDYGRWKCSMRDEKLEITPNIHLEENIEILKDTVYVTRGKEMTVNCSLDRGWSFCRVQSPKGYFGSRSKFRPGLQSFTDNNNGAPTDDCSMVIASAQDDDVGNWTCLLDTYDGPEKKVIVPVRVLDAETIADVMRKDWPEAMNVTTLECRPLPNQDKKIVPGSCVWTKPNGNRVKTDESKYKMILSDNVCHLYSTDFDDDDVGEWSCRAVLIGSHHLLANIVVGPEFVDSSWLFWLITISIVSIASTVLIFIIIAAIIHYRRHCRGKSYETAE